MKGIVGLSSGKSRIIVSTWEVPFDPKLLIRDLQDLREEKKQNSNL